MEGVTLFKKRTKFGEYVDKYLGYGGQERIKEISGLNRDTVSKACNDGNYIPTKSVQNLLISTLKELTKVDVTTKDFW